MSDEKQETMFGPNEARHRRCSQPHANADAANVALEAFYTAVGKAREEHGIANVYVLCETSILNDEGDEFPAASTAGFGDSVRFERMCARGLGLEAARRQEEIGALLAKGVLNRKHTK